jgi:chaperonin GroES
MVERLEEHEQTKGGIIIPDTAREKPMEARVIAVGPGRVADDGKYIPMDIKEGDTVLVGKYSGTDIKYDEADYLILRVDEILAVLEK